MRLNIKHICLPLLFLPVLAAGQTGGKSFIEQTQARDTVTIADQLEYGMVIDTLEKGCLPLFPELQGEGIEFIGDWKLDTLQVNRPAPGDSITYQLRAAHRFTTFEPGAYTLPEMEVVVRNPEGDRFDTLRFESQNVEFMDIPVDTAAFKRHEAKGPLAYPKLPKSFPWKVVLIVLGSLAAAGLAGWGIWYLVRKKQQEKAPEHKDPAYIVALRGLEGFRGAPVADHDQQKAFYSGITDVLRNYIDETYEVSAPEMTTAEIFSALKDKDIPSEMQRELRELFERADFVKFAKHMAGDIENAGALPLAIRFVTESYQQEMAKASAQAQEGETSKGETVK